MGAGLDVAAEVVSGEATSMPPGPRRGSKLSGACWRAWRARFGFSSASAEATIKMFSLPFSISTESGDNSVEKLVCEHATINQAQRFGYHA
jgi:hypothetical protein